MKTLEQAINDAAKELPIGWILTINVEAGSAWVMVEIPGGATFFPSSDWETTLAEEVAQAVSFTKRRLQ